MAMNDPFPIINLAALGQVDELEGYPTTHQHATAVSSPTASLTSPTAAAAAALHHAHHHHHYKHRRSCSSTGSTKATGGALALINRGWNRLGGAVGGPRVSHNSARYDGSSHHHYQHDVSSSTIMPYSPEEAFQIKLSLMMKNPAIMARFQERLRADSPYHGHDTVIRIEMQDFFVNELVLVDIGPEIRQAKMRLGAAAAASATSSSRSSLFRSLGALVNKTDETTTTPVATTSGSDGSSSSSSSAVQQLQSSSPTASTWLNMSPFKNGGIPADSSNAQNTAADDATTTPGGTCPTSPELDSLNNSNEKKRPAFLNLPSLEIQNNTTTIASSPILENSVYEHEFSMSSSSSSASEETPDATESSCESSSSSHDDDSLGLSAATTTTCIDTHDTQVATAAESPSSDVYFEMKK